jgi:hypothetical protein
MEKPMKKPKLPKTDSIKKLAEFWDNHDLTDFQDELKDVNEPVFVRDTAIKVPLETHEAEALEQLARARGISREELVRRWVVQRVHRPSTTKAESNESGAKRRRPKANEPGRRNGKAGRRNKKARST